ncbi:MAG: hypothetical protein KF773_03315 [Deltaproteobacteria bacterium]|nr:hypothetical protein [Deltaproteobacteria bacterium]
MAGVRTPWPESGHCLQTLSYLSIERTPLIVITREAIATKAAEPRMLDEAMKGR